MKTQEIKVSSDQYLKKKRLRKKRLVRLLIWLKRVMLVSLTVTSLVLLGLSPLFNISRIEVKGNQHYHSGDIEKSAGIIMGNNGFKSIGSSWRNVFTLRFGESEHMLMKSKPYIKQAIVRYILPKTVRITVVERQPAAVVTYMGNKVIVDKEGFALELLSDSGSQASLPEILGAEIKECEIGQALRYTKSSQKDGFFTAMELLMNIMQSDEISDDKLYKHIDLLDVRDHDNILLGIDNRFKVNFGHLQDIDHNLNFFRHIYFSTLKHTNDRGILDMTAKDPVLMEE